MCSASFTSRRRLSSPASAAAVFSQDPSVLPPFTSAEFSQHKRNASRLLARLPTTAQQAALDELRTDAPGQCHAFCLQAERRDSDALLRHWRSAVAASASADEALAAFLRALAGDGEPGVPGEALQNAALLAWGRALVALRFAVPVPLPYTEFVQALRQEMARHGEPYGCDAFVVGGQHLAKLQDEHVHFTGAHWREKLVLVGASDATGFADSHCICGGAGTGKTHFALHSVTQQVPWGSTNPLVFYIHAPWLKSMPSHDTLVAAHNRTVGRAKDTDEDAHAAREARNRAACEVLQQCIDGCVSPYELVKGSAPADPDARPDAFVILDDASASAPMLEALMSDTHPCAAALLREHYQCYFRRLYAMVVSPVAVSGLVPSGDCRRERLVCEVTPTVALLRHRLRSLGLDSLFNHWIGNTACYYFFCNPHCVIEVLDIIACNQGSFLLLNRMVKTFANLQRTKPKVVDWKAEWCSDVREAKKALVQVTLRTETESLEPFDALTDISDAADIMRAAAEGLSRLQLWLFNIITQRYHKNDVLCSLTVERYTQLVRRATLLSLCGPDPTRGTTDDCSDRLDLDAAVAAGLAVRMEERGEGTRTLVTHRAGLHHIAIAMTHELKAQEEQSARCRAADLLSFDGQQKQVFVSELLSYLCRVVCEARPHRSNLSLLHVLDQFRWPQGPVNYTCAETQVREAVEATSSRFSGVMHWKSPVAYPFTPDETEADEMEVEEVQSKEEEALESFCAGVSDSPSHIHVILNGKESPYADLVLLHGDVLFVVAVITEHNFNKRTEEVWDRAGRLGFDTSKSGKKRSSRLREYPTHVAATEKLARRLGCRFAVPVFALLAEPFSFLERKLPLVDVSVAPSGGDAPSASRRLMKPIVLHIKSHIQHTAGDAS